MLALNPKHIRKVIFVIIAFGGGGAFGGIKQPMEHIYIQNTNIREAIPLAYQNVIRARKESQRSWNDFNMAAQQ